MKFFILAGGYGERARPLSLVKPKPAFPLHGTPLIKLLLDQLNEKGFNEGFINLHYMPEAIRESTGDTPGLSINYLYEDELSGSKILRQALTDMADTDEFLFVLNGDVFLEVLNIPIEKMLYELKETHSDGALLLRKNTDPAYPSVLTENGFFQGTEKKNNGKESFMYTGVALFRKKIIEKIDDIRFFNSLEKYRFKIKTFVYKDIWLDIGSPQLYFDGNTIYKNHLRKNNDLNSLSENVTISDDSRVSNCIIWENTKITAGSFLSNCIVTNDLTLKGVKYKDRIVYAKDESSASGGQGALLKNRPLDPHKTFDNTKKANAVLYIVSTPIGNMDDITYRAIQILSSVDALACEDTRYTRKIFSRYEIPTPKIFFSYHEHNEETAGKKILKLLEEDKQVALCTDSGTPAISDPGYRIISEAIKQGYHVDIIPGPSAVTSALLASGLPTSSFTFKGFPPRKKGPRAKFLEMEKDMPHTMVFFESPYRVETFLRDALEILGNRLAAVCIDLTKLYEEIHKGYLEELWQIFLGRKIKGEVTIIIAGNNPKFIKSDE